MTNTTTPLLEARSLSVGRHGDAGILRVLDGLDLAVVGGALTDIVGPSGSGKTTLLLALARLLPGATGELLLRGEPAQRVEPRLWRTKVAYLPQRSSMFPGTVEDNLLLAWRLSVRSGLAVPDGGRLREVLDSVHLGDVALDRDASRLSEGQAARIALLRTVLTGPDVLLLDEPDAALDDESARQVGLLTRRFVDEGGAAVRVRHLRGDGHADRRMRLTGGRLVEESA